MAHDPISPSFMKEKWGDQTISVLYQHTKWRSFSRQCVTEKGIRPSRQSMDMIFTSILSL